jgi:two-component system, NarL family, invasion response regulator UvrY
MRMKCFLLIDDHEIVRIGVKFVIQSLFAPCEVYEATEEASALSRLKERDYHLIVMDVHMPHTNSFGLLEYIKINFPTTRVLVFSMGAENVYAKKFLQAGAVGFVSKNAGLAELQKAIEAGLKGHKYISTELANQLISGLNDQTDNPFHGLTPKEFEIASLLMASKSVTDISKTLNISTSTVGTHKARILKKLNARDIIELNEIGKQYNIQG